MNDYKFGNFIYTLRVERGYTQAQIAQLLGVSPAAVSKWENGSTKPKYETLLKLAQIFDVKTEELIAGEYIQSFEQELQPEPMQKPRPSMTKIFAMVFCAIATIGCLILALTYKGQTEVGNINSNCQDYCAIVKRGDWIYYCNINRDNDVYKIRTDGTQKQKLVEASATSIAVSDQWIYYCDSNMSAGDAGIYRVKHDGTQKELVTVGAYWYLCVTDDWIYYADGNSRTGGNLYRMKPDGTRVTKLNDRVCANINIVGDWIYYLNKNSGFVYKMHLDGTDDRKVKPHQRVISLVAEDNVLYTYDSKQFKRINFDGTDERTYKQEGVDRFVIKDGCIYFVKSNSQRSIFYKLDTDMSKQTKILRVEGLFPSLYMCIIDDYLYFPNGEDGYRMYRVKTDGSGKVELVG